MGVAAGLFGGFVHGDGAALRVGVEEEERLEVVFDAFADHVFPPGANLQKTDDGQQVLFGSPSPFWASAAPESCLLHTEEETVD